MNMNNSMDVPKLNIAVGLTNPLYARINPRITEGIENRKCGEDYFYQIRFIFRYLTRPIGETHGQEGKHTYYNI